MLAHHRCDSLLASPTLLILSACTVAVARLGGSDTLPLASMAKQWLDLDKFPLARCLDGSPGAFYVASASSGADATKWLIYLEGGGWCFSPHDCILRQKLDLGSSLAYPDFCRDEPGSPCHWQGLASRDCTTSPDFCNFNHVFVKYCDATSFSGSRSEPLRYDCYGECDEATMYFNGKQLLEGVIDTLLADFGLELAQEVLLTGCSAGGLGTLLNADSVHERIKRKAPSLRKYGVAPSSGFFLAHDSVEGSALFATAMKATSSFANWTVSHHCSAALGIQRWKCILAEHAYEYVEAPVFVLNSALDWWQTAYTYTRSFLDGVGPSGAGIVPGWSACASNVTECGAAQLPFMNEYMDNFRLALGRASTFSKLGNGAFVNACHWHCEATSCQDWGQPWLNFKVDGVAMQAAVSSWWASDFLEPAENHTHMEQCRYSLGSECNPTCTIFVSDYSV